MITCWKNSLQTIEENMYKNFENLQKLDFKDFSNFPIGRNKKDSDNNGEYFTKSCVLSYLWETKNQKDIIFKINNLMVHSLSFFDEVFSILIQQNYIESHFLLHHFKIQHTEKQKAFVLNIFTNTLLPKIK